MKIFIWMLTLSMVLGSVDSSIWTTNAYATEPVVNGTQTGGTIKSPTSGQLTQEQTEQQTEDLNKAGQQQSTMLGTMTIAAGAGMVAAGMACTPAPCGGLIAAGAAMIASGLLALAAAAKMAKNAGIASGYNSNLSNITGVNPLGANALPNGSADGGIKIDPNLLRTGKADAIFEDMEKKTGMSREDFAKGLENGVPVSKMMADANKKLSASAIDKAIASADGSSMTAGDMMEKLGLSAADLGSAENAYAGGGGVKNNSSGASTAFDGFGKPTDPTGSATIGAMKVSDDIQAALDQNGITGRSIFEMVNTQYKKKTPQMFGIIQDKSRVPASTENPFGNLDSGNIEL